MKKLAILLMIPALFIFMAATASAQDVWGAIRGTYAMISSGSCLHSTLGFNGNNTPITGTGSVVWGATTMAQAIWTFNSNGTGTVSNGWNYVLDFPPGSPVFGGPIGRQNAFSFNFQYGVDRDGVITVYPPSPPNLQGTISTDDMTLTLGSANQPQNSALGPAICNIARVLYRVSD